MFEYHDIDDEEEEQGPPKTGLAKWWDDNIELVIFGVIVLAIDAYLYHRYLLTHVKIWGYCAASIWFTLGWWGLFRALRSLVDFFSRRMKDNSIPGCLLYFAFIVLSLTWVLCFIFSDRLWAVPR